AFKPVIRSRWEQGCHNATQITRELKEIGYTGGCSIVKEYVLTLRCAERSPWEGTEEPSSSIVPRGPAAYAPRRIVALVLRKPTERNPKDAAVHNEIGGQCEPFQELLSLARGFLNMMRRPKGSATKVGSDELAAWLTEAENCGTAEMRNFAKGLVSDRAAVEVAMALPWSNGPVEGAIQRLKVIKRQMYGRANFDLLRRRVLEPVQI
ncbi:MAG TPA: transposase, partial [Armatimonadota bacterium]